ncbi:hypothetical protein SAMN05660461_1716 [Chitinophaga ginsengisegetis]|uniref:Uncharacterized protein n=1 Tax=Chitinophaga ginsengisegetis TaxID=393003 RepID=A0A1T5NIA9_9BACT|nr:hypothetical protein [Chitinophaga ginsengisegetis]SKD00146.1 hypothetical protein SAMN05660461_1716 [Chitinophaga ginsengisegetis]
MRTTSAILSKIFTQRFYIQNTGFFLVLFYLLFGVVNGANLLAYHKGLMLGFLGNYTFLVLVLLLWTSYALKCVGFMLKTFQLQGYDFLYPTMGSIAKPARRIIWLRLHTAIYMPVLVYVAIALVIAVQQGYYPQAVIIAVVNIANCIWPLALYERKLEQPDVIFFTGHLQRWINRHFTKPPVLFFLYELFTNFPRRIVSTKLFSAGVLWLTFLIMARGDYFDLRGLQLGVMISVLSHMQLMVHHRAFDDTYLNFMENLPVSLFTHYMRLVGVYVITFLPEMIIITANAYTKTTPWGLITVFCTALSLMILFRTLLFFPKMNPEVHVRYTMLTSFIVLFMILGHYEWPAVLLLQTASAIIFFTKYRTYEPYIETGS